MNTTTNKFEERRRQLKERLQRIAGSPSVSIDELIVLAFEVIDQRVADLEQRGKQ